tara:strand:- start:1525 stop:2532 length:1008 start_codon:yes stop_codon:yes gene_type:complete
MNDNIGRGIFKKTERIIGIGDLHGDMMQLLSILKHSKMIEKKNKERMCINDEDFVIDEWRWIGGNTYIVQMGDIFDGGGRKEVDEFDDKEVEILIFLMRLKKLAKDDGGDVLIIFGNHEYMNFNNNYGYVQKKTLSKCIIKGKGELDVEYKHKKNEKCNEDTRRKLFRKGGDGVLAKIISKYCYGILKIGSTIFCHGGLKKEIGYKYSINYMNILLQKYLLNILNSKEKREFHEIYGTDGIIWFRGYVNNMEKNCKELAKCLEEKKAKRMVVGHTVQVDGITTKCKNQKKLYAIDVGLSRAFSQRKAEYLEILDDDLVKEKKCNILLKECVNKFR